MKPIQVTFMILVLFAFCIHSIVSKLILYVKITAKIFNHNIEFGIFHGYSSCFGIACHSRSRYLILWEIKNEIGPSGKKDFTSSLFLLKINNFKASVRY